MGILLDSIEAFLFCFFHGSQIIIAGLKMNAYLRSVASDFDAVPGSSIAVQTYGDFLNFNPHLHAITTDGCFLNDGSFKAAPGFILEDLEEIFQYEVLKMLKKEGKINDAVIENMLSWRHSSFHVYIGDRITPSDKTDRKSRKVFNALDWLARLLRHLDLWDIRNHDPPQKVSDYILELVCDEADSQIPELESWY